MTLPIPTRYALRSLLRHKRRTFLSIVGIGVGCGICLFLIAFVSGEGEMMMRAAAQTGVGHLRVAPAEWVKTRENDLRLSDWQPLLEDLRAMEHVEVAAPHAVTDALLAMGTRTAGVVMIGVDPDVEPAINRLVREVARGEYLTRESQGETVIGKGLAERLDVGVGDDLMVTASGTDGDLKSAMLRVRGIVATGSRSLDNSLCDVLLADVANVSGRPGAAEISILLKNHERMPETKDAVARLISPNQTVVSWEVIVPELADGVKVDETWTNLIVGVVVIVVFLGIASAQLAAVLERRKEFAVLSAVGMKGGRLVRIMLAEGLVLGLTGAVLALLLAVPVVYWTATHGIDFGEMMKDADLTMSNIMLDPVIYTQFGWWLVPLAFGLSLIATMLSSLYPAWYALGVDPAEALRVEQ